MSDCIKFYGHVDDRGRGQTYGGRFGHKFNVSAHRAAWMNVHGPIPKGMMVLHSCDHPWCVNVEHLRLGTHLENMANMRSRQRSANGERQHLSKLTEGSVIWIRKIRAAGVLSLQKIGELFGVSKQTVDSISKGETWGHVYGGSTTL